MHKSINLVVFAISLLLVVSTAFAVVSSKDAVKFVSEENHFLYPEEEFEQPNFKVRHAENEYWVIPITADDSPTTFFAVNAGTKEVEQAKVVNSALFKTADLLRELLKEKEKISKNQQVEWLITAAYAETFNNFERLLKKAELNLNTIDTALNNADASTDVTSLKRKLSSMQGMSLDIASKINKATALETEFTINPKTTQFKELKEEFLAVFESINSLNQSKIDYDEGADKLKQKISLSNLTSNEKGDLIKWADLPETLHKISNYSSNATQLKQLTETLYLKVNSRAENFLNELESRIERNQAYNKLYAEETEVKKINSKLKNLKHAVENVLSEENRSKWKEQSKVNDLEKNWKNTELFFKKGDYKMAEEYASKSLLNVKKIFEEGFTETEDKPWLSQETINLAIIVLIVLLVLLYLAGNWKKLAKGKEKGDESLDLSAWEEKV